MVQVACGYGSWPGLHGCSLSGRALPCGLFNGLIWPKVGFASIAYDATAPIDFLPLPAARSFLAKQQSRLSPSSAHAAVASDAPSIASGLLIAIEAEMGAGSNERATATYPGHTRHLHTHQPKRISRRHKHTTTPS